MSVVTREPVRPGSPELAALLARIAEGAEERERERIAPFEVIPWVKKAGLGRLRIPVEEGGAGATLPQLFETVIALAEADSHVAHILRAHFSFVEYQLQSADRASRARWLSLVNQGALFGNGISEQGGLQVGRSFQTTLARDADGVLRLNGAKFYSTGTIYSDWTQIFASTPEGTVAIATIPVDREGVTLEDDWDGFGQGLTGTGTTRLANVLVRDEEVVDMGSPDDPEQPPRYQGAILQLYLQAVTVGVLRAVRNDAVALVRRRKRSFSHAHAELPAEDPQVLQVVGEIASDAFAAEAIVLRAAEAIQVAADSVTDGVPGTRQAREAQIAAAQAKVAVDRFSYATAAALFDAGGASATQARHNLDRHWRNVRTISTHNPAFLKASVTGDWLVNGTPPPLNGLF